ncbi:hypothetical protein H3V53_14810 [Paraburkholderia bengalensis]|uniref:Phosphoadenosine phosphosulphate reductase domain-containing protein n=1 Tax=Paraburkholderia bengalensis TaxID=2747562 RepID=A0ABU8ISK3_9BURK
MDRDIHTLMENAIASMQSYIEQGHVLAAGVSGGKDSTCAMVLMLEAVRRAKQVASDVRHYITSSDTTIEIRISSGRNTCLCKLFGNGHFILA